MSEPIFPTLDEVIERYRGYVSDEGKRTSFLVEGDLRREIQLNTKRLVEIGSYRGLRHRRGPRVGRRTRAGRGRRTPAAVACTRARPSA